MIVRYFTHPVNVYLLDTWTQGTCNKKYIARQLGHTNANMLFRVYSKWIDGADKSRERDKLNIGFGHDLATE